MSTMYSYVQKLALKKKEEEGELDKKEKQLLEKLTVVTPENKAFDEKVKQANASLEKAASQGLDKATGFATQMASSPPKYESGVFHHMEAGGKAGWASVASTFSSMQRFRDTVKDEEASVSEKALTGVLAAGYTAVSPYVTTFTALTGTTKKGQAAAEWGMEQIEKAANNITSMNGARVRMNAVDEVDKTWKTYGYTKEGSEKVKEILGEMDDDLRLNGLMGELLAFGSYFVLPALIKKGYSKGAEVVKFKKGPVVGLDFQKAFKEALNDARVNKARLAMGLKPLVLDPKSKKLIEYAFEMKKDLKKGEVLLDPLKIKTVLRVEPRFQKPKFVQWYNDFVKKHIPEEAVSGKMKEAYLLSEKAGKKTKGKVVEEAYSKAVEIMGVKDGKFTFGEKKMAAYQSPWLAGERPGVEKPAALTESPVVNVPVDQIGFGLSEKFMDKAVGNRPKVEQLKQDIQGGAKIAVPVKKTDGGYVLDGDGFHRLTAYKELGIKTVPTTEAVSSAYQPLAAEAKKFKTAEEFVGDQVFFRGERGSEGKGAYFTKSKEFATEFAGGDPLTEVGIESIYTPGKLPSAKSDQEVSKAIQEAKDNGFKAVMVSEGSPFGEAVESVFVFDKSAIKTKAQLTDIYNQANLPDTALKTDKFAYKTGKPTKDIGVAARDLSRRKIPKTLITERQFYKMKESTAKKAVEEFSKERKDLIEEVKQILPAEQASRFSNAIAEATSRKKEIQLMARARIKAQEVNRQNLIKEFERERKFFNKNAKKISVDYQTKLREVLEAFEKSKPTVKTTNRLKSLAEFIKKNGEIGIPPHYVRSLERLQKKSLRDLGTSSLQELTDTVRGLRALGELKFKRFQNHYNEKVYKKNLKFLVDGTNPTIGDKFLDKARIEYLQPARVLDTIDGYQGYKGVNATFNKKLAAAEEKAYLDEDAEVSGLFKELQGAGIEEIPGEVAQTVMALHIYKDMKALDQVDALMKDNGLTAIPSLNARDKIIVEKLKKYAGKEKLELKTLWEEIEKKEFIEIDNYFPIKYEKKALGQTVKEPSESLAEVLNRDYGRKRDVKLGAGMKRKKGVKLLPRTDVFNVLIEAIKERKYYMNMKPILYEYAPLYYSKEFAAKAGETPTKFAKDYIDVVANGGQASNVAKTALDPLLRTGRINISKAMLGWKLSTAAIQPLAIFPALSYTITHHPQLAGALMGNFFKAFLAPGFSKKVIKESQGLKAREGGEEILRELSEQAGMPGQQDFNLSDVFWKESFAVLQYLDLKTAASLQKTFLDEFKKTMPLEEAKTEADFLMRLLSASSLVSDKPLILSKGEGWRSALTFQTFLLNEFGLLVHDVVKRGIVDGSFKVKMLGILALGVLITGKVLEDELRTALANFVKGTDYETNPKATAILALPEMIPHLGAFITAVQYRSKPTSPIVGKASDIGTGIKQLFTGKAGTTKAKGLIKTLEAIGTLGGIPGAVQMGDIIEGVVERSSSGRKTSGFFTK